MSTPDNHWLAGAAVSIFSAEAGTPLAGYAARTGSAIGSLDPLVIAAVVLEAGSERLALVSADVAAVDAELRKEIAAATNLKLAELAICASHTHSGPAGVVARLHPADPNHLDPELRARFVSTVARTIEVARRGMIPVDLLFGSTQTDGIATNRNSPGGPYDPRLSVLATRQRDGMFQAVLVHFACHPTILGANNLSFSADFPGALRRNVSASLAQPTSAPIVVFVNGAAGDVSTRFTRRGQDAEEVDRIGALLGAAAMEALGKARVLNGPLRHARARVTLRTRTDYYDAGSHLPSDAPANESSSVTRIKETRNQGKSMLAALAALPVEAIPSMLELDAWSLGELAMIAMPGELVSSCAAQIHSASATKTLILGYTNGYAGYLVDRAAHGERTYEALASPFTFDAGERVVEVSIALIREVLSGRKTAQVAVENDRAVFE